MLQYSRSFGDEAGYRLSQCGSFVNSLPIRRKHIVTKMAQLIEGEIRVTALRDYYVPMQFQKQHWRRLA